MFWPRLGIIEVERTKHREQRFKIHIDKRKGDHKCDNPRPRCKFFPANAQIMCDAWAFLFNFSKYRKVPHNHAGDKERERICEQSPPRAMVVLQISSVYPVRMGQGYGVYLTFAISRSNNMVLFLVQPGGDEWLSMHLKRELDSFRSSKR